MAMQFKASERSLGEILGACWRYKLRIIFCAVVFAIAGLAIARQLAPTYTAYGTMIIEAQQLSLPDVRQFTNPFAVTPGDPSAVMRSESTVIRSRQIIEAVIRQLDLTHEPEVNPYLRPPGLVGRSLAGLRDALPPDVVETLDGIGIRLPRPLARVPTPEEIADATMHGLLQRLDVGSDNRSFIINLAYRSEQPQLASRIVNAVMDAYIAQQIANKLQATADANAWLNQRIAQLRGEVEAADQAVQAFRLRYGIVDTRQGTVAQQQVAELNTQLITAEAEAAAAEATLRSAGTGAAARATVESPLISRMRERESDLMARETELSERLGTNHPQLRPVTVELRQLRGRIAAETERIRQSLANTATAARSRVAALRAQLRVAQEHAARNAEGEAQLAQLQREADSRRAIYQRLQEQAQQTTGASRANQADARVITAAVAPSLPTGPRSGLLAAGSGLIGLLLAAAASLLIAELDRGFERTEELEAATGLTALGAFPLVRKRNADSLVEFATRNPASAEAETLRGFVQALRRSAGNRGSKVLLVTSSLPGEGKTSLAAAMAGLLANDGLLIRDGRRVLLIEADFRRPQIGAYFRRPVPVTAFEDVLVGDGQWTDALQQDPYTGLAYLSATRATDSPQGLLGSPQWARIIAEARLSFDLIIIDTPPVMSVTDTMAIAEHADATMLVVGWRSTQRRIVLETIKRLKRGGLPVTGAVLSKVQGRIESAEYYAGYYGPSDQLAYGRRNVRAIAPPTTPAPALARTQLEGRASGTLAGPGTTDRPAKRRGPFKALPAPSSGKPRAPTGVPGTHMLARG